MSARYRWGLVATLVLQLALLGWMIADRAMLIASGREVRFAVEPVDPRDLFRGDYVILSYPFSRVSSGRVGGEDTLGYQDPVYVSLAETGGAWQAVSLSRTPPPDGLYLRGTIVQATGVDAEDGDDCSPIVGCTAYDIEYGIEQFFVPEGTGRELEALRNDERLSVDVAVGSDGRAALKRLLVDGTVRYDEPFY